MDCPVCGRRRPVGEGACRRCRRRRRPGGHGDEPTQPFWSSDWDWPVVRRRLIVVTLVLTLLAIAAVFVASWWEGSLPRAGVTGWTPR